MHAAAFLNARIFPAVFVDSMPNHSKQGVRDTELEVLDDLHVVRRNDDAEIAQPGHLSAFEPGQPDVESTRFARHLESQQHVGCGSTAAYPKGHIARLNARAQLLRKHLLVRRVICPGSDERYVVGQRQRPESFMVVAGHCPSLAEIASKV